MCGVALKKSNCKNCYKCIRHCPVKSIRFSGNQAHIIEQECILCGQCVVVCPQDAKQIVDESEKVRVMLQTGAPVVVSLAPSFIANYGGAGIEQMRAALKKLGFYDVEETAVGATYVKREYERILREEKRDVLISSCCHSVNLLIQKYFPSLLPMLADGLGSGVKASILSTLTSKIISTMLAAGLPLEECVSTIAGTLPICSVRGVAYSTFMIIHIIGNETAVLIQYDNPLAILIRDEKVCEYPMTEMNIGGKKIFRSEIRLKENDLQEVKPYVDSVLTFEELQALFDSCDMDITALDEDVLDNASYFGRIFARSGGLADAVAESLKEQGIDDFELSACTCDGIDECRTALMKKSRNVLKAIPHDHCVSDAQSDFSSDCIENSQAYYRMARIFCVI